MNHPTLPTGPDPSPYSPGPGCVTALILLGGSLTLLAIAFRLLP